MPRGYVRTGKNADPENVRRRAAAASASRDSVDKLVRRLELRAAELTAEHRAVLAGLAGGEA